MRTDLHQHLLPEDLLAALARRTGSPRIVRDGRGWTLRLAGEPACVLDLSDHNPAERSRLAEQDGLDRVVLSISSPLGIEPLPAEEAEPLLAAYNHGALELGGPFATWGAVGLDGAAPDSVAWAPMRSGRRAACCATPSPTPRSSGPQRVGL